MRAPLRHHWTDEDTGSTQMSALTRGEGSIAPSPSGGVRGPQGGPPRAVWLGVRGPQGGCPRALCSGLLGCLDPGSTQAQCHPWDQPPGSHSPARLLTEGSARAQTQLLLAPGSRPVISLFGCAGLSCSTWDPWSSLRHAACES